MSQGKFWMVVGRGAPTHRHPSKQSAKTEAERLASYNPGTSFVVLESLAQVTWSALQWELTDLDGSEETNEIPF